MANAMTQRRGGRRLRRPRRAAGGLLALLFLAAWAPPTFASVIVQSVTIGFKSRARGQPHHQGVVRKGSWIPVVVDLQLENQSSFDGTLRVAQFDNDGDVCFDQVPVHLLTSTGGAQRYWLYILPSGHDSDQQFKIDVLDENGESVTVIYNGVPRHTVRVEDRPSELVEEELLLLDISVGGGAHASDLSDPELSGQLFRDVHTARLAAGDLPEHWLGLEAVDFIVWDEADPADFKSEAQLQALVDWVRWGGTLIISAARTAGSLAGTQTLDALLPVDIGQVTRVNDLGAIPQRLLGVESKARSDAEREKFIPDPLLEPVAIVPCRRRQPATTFSFYEDTSRPELDGLITRHRVGQGHVIFCGVTMQDLFTKVQGLKATSVEALRQGRVTLSSAVELYKRLLFLRTESRQDELGSSPLYPHVQTPINFLANTTAFFLLSFLFIGAYGVTATVVTWSVLKRRGWLRHSWSAFSAVAVAASVLSVMVVQSVRGFGQSVEQLSIIDLAAGESYARGMALFGLKTGTHTVLDLWLPSDPLMHKEPGATRCFLRPAPRVVLEDRENETPTTYADPGRYRLVPASALLEGVPIRATLKKLEGRWEGPIDGSVQGQVALLPNAAARRQSGSLFTEDSFILNGLKTDLTKCYLLFSDYEYVLSSGQHNDDVGDRLTHVYALPLANLPAGQRFSLGKFDHLAERAKADDENAPDVLGKYFLAEEQKRWRRPLRSLVSAIAGSDSSPEGKFDMRLEPFQCALLLASTLTDMEQPPQVQYGAPRVLSRDHLRLLDIHASLRPDTAILIGFVRDAGPIRLASRKSGSEGQFRTIAPRKGDSWTMYRVMIPVSKR